MAYKLGLSVDTGFPLSVGDSMRLIRRTGFDAFFTGWRPDAPIAAYARLAEELGLIYQSIHAPFGGMNEVWNGSEKGVYITDSLIRCVDDCAENRVPLMVLHPFIGFEDHTPTAVGLELIGRVVRAAEDRGVLLGFENVEGPEYLKAIMDGFSSSPVVKFCWDTGHEQCYNYGIDQLSLYGDRLAGTHFNDNLGIVTGRTDPNGTTWLDDLHLLPFDGIIDWQNVMDRIRRVNYTGILTFELTIHSKPGKHENDPYKLMGPEGYAAEVYRRACRIAEL